MTKDFTYLVVLTDQSTDLVAELRKAGSNAWKGLRDRLYSPDEYKLWSSSLCNFLHSPVTSSLLGPNILLRTLFLSLCSSLSVRDQVSHPYKTTGRIFYILPSANLCTYVYNGFQIPHFLISLPSLTTNNWKNNYKKQSSVRILSRKCTRKIPGNSRPSNHPTS
jgi:hypothetical protein